MASASRFLPPGFDPTQTVAVIAGKGRYPSLLVECARARGADVKLVSFEEETDPALIAAFDPADHRPIPVGKLGQMLDALQELGAAGAVMAGQVTPRKLFTGMVPDLKLIALMASLKERNAETIFGAISAEIEKVGVRMLDARVFLDDHLATPGCLTGWLAGVADDELAFPSYDGNGMFLSMGNIEASAKIGMLFIDMETPRRLRLQATATLVDDDATLARRIAAGGSTPDTLAEPFLAESVII